MKFTSRPEIKFIFSILFPFKWYLAGLVVLNLLIGATALVYPYLVKIQTDQLLQANTNLFGLVTGSPYFIFLLVVFLVIFFSGLEQIFNLITSLFNERIRKKLTVQAEGAFFEKLAHLDSGFLNNPRNVRVTQSIYRISYIFESFFYLIPENFRRILTFVGVLPIILTIDYRIGLFATVMSLVDYFLYRLKLRRTNHLLLASENIAQKMYSLQHLLLFNFQKILLIDRSQKVINAYKNLQNNQFKYDFRRFDMEQTWNIFFWLAENATTAIITIVFGYQVLKGQFSIGDFSMVTLYVMQLKRGLSSLLSSVNEWRRLEMDFLKVGFFINLKPKYTLKAPVYQGDLSGDIVFKDVSFGYPALDKDERDYMQYMMDRQHILQEKMRHYYEKEEYEEWKKFMEVSFKPNPLIIKNFNLKLEKNKITALIGRNGAGKTTCTNLLLRLYDTVDGEITFKGVPLNRIDPSHLRQFVSVLTQENFLIDSFSLRDNLTLGVNRNVTDQELCDLLDRFSVLNNLSRLPKGLDSILGDDTQLSGGQRQLLSIIRIYLQARPFVIFDEGTNQLDAEHEDMVMKMLKEMKKHSTILMITHKLTSARRADHIFVLEEGQISESGKHADLLEKNGLYSRFWKMQVID